jgi:hypothetical protein
MTITAVRSFARALALVAFVIVALVAVSARAVVVRTAVGYRAAPVYHPAMRTAAVVGTAAVTDAAVGTVVHSLPSACTAVMVGNVAYQQCGSTWYQPTYAGTTVNYTVVNPPR